MGVRLFAAIRDAAGVDSLQLSARSVGDVSLQLQRRFPQVEQLLLRCRFAVNQEFASNETQLKSGDEVAVIPPVSGG